MPESIRIRARDGQLLAGDLFLPAGLPRGYYGPFAAFLARQGMAALTLDYRGVGGSRHGPLRTCPATLSDWAEHDLGGAVDLLTGRMSDVPLLWVGHSIGGQLLGLLAGVDVAGALLVGAQSGDPRLFPGTWRWRMWLFWHALIPGLVPLLGHLPAAILGGGEDIPPRVALEWATWGRAPDYVMSHARPRGGLAFATLSAPIHLWAISDDPYAPLASVEALAGFFSAAPAQVRRIRPADIGVRTIGHFGFFRARFEPTLWREAALFLADAASRGSRSAPSPGEKVGETGRRR